MPVIIIGGGGPIVIPAIQPLPAAPSAGDGATTFATKAANFFEGLASMVAQYNIAGSGYGAMTPLPPRPTDRSAGFAAESDTFLASLPGLVTEVNAKIAQLSLPTAPVSALPNVPDRVDDPNNFATESALFLAAMGSLGGQLGGFINAFNAYAPAVSSFYIVGPSSVPEGNTAGVVFTVHRSGAIDQIATLDWAVQAISGGLTASDFGGGVLTSGTLYYSAGQRSAGMTLFVNDDASVEGDEAFKIVILTAFMLGGAPANIVQDTATAVITDNDTGAEPPAGASTFSITSPSPAAINEGPKSTSTNFVFTVSRTGALTQAAYVDWTVSGSGPDPATPIDFGVADFPLGTLSFAANESSKSLIVSVKGDTLVEPDEGFTITLSNPRMGDATAAAIGSGSASATILNDDSTSSSGDDDVASFSISAPSAANEGDAGATLFVFPVTRVGGLSFAAAVDYAVSGSGGSAAAASDFVSGALPVGTLNFSAGQSTANISIQVQGDTGTEPDEGFTVTLSNARTFGTLATAAASSTILNDDTGSGPAAATSTFTMTQLAAANRVYQRTTTSGGGQGKGQGTIPVTISGASGGTINARCSSGGSTRGDLQAEWTAATISNGATVANIAGVDARLGWFYLDLLDSSGVWKNGAVLVGMGRLFWVSGQSLAARMFRAISDPSTTIASLGITVNPNGVVFGQGDAQPGGGTPFWALPSDGDDLTHYNSAFAADLLRLEVPAAGVNCALVGAATGSTQIADWITSGSQVAIRDTVLAGINGFEAAAEFIGHTNSLLGTSAATFQAGLTTLFSELASHNAARGASFEKYVLSIPNIATTIAWGTAKRIAGIRAAAAAWAAANSATYLQPANLSLADGIHEDQPGARTLARHIYRATRTALGLTHDDTGPSISGASRASGSGVVALSINLPSGASALSAVGNPKSRFFVTGPNGMTFRRPVTALGISGSTINLTLSPTPPNNAPLDLWFDLPPAPSGDGSADMIYDNNTDSDGITLGRQLQTNVAPIVVAAPVPSLGPNLTASGATWGSGASGFGQCRTAGYGESSFSTGYGDDVIPFSGTWSVTVRFKIASAPSAYAGIFTLGALNNFFAVNSSGKLFFTSQNAAVVGTANVCDNAWHTAHLVIDGDNGCKIYLDGSLDGSSSDVYTLDGLTTGQFRLGSLHFGANDFGGSLDEFASWSIAKSGTPASGPFAGTETGLYALYHLDGNFNAG